MAALKQTSPESGEVPGCAGYFVQCKVTRLPQYLVYCKGEAQSTGQKRQAEWYFGSFRGSPMNRGQDKTF